jgi:hypothetical protein
VHFCYRYKGMPHGPRPSPQAAALLHFPYTRRGGWCRQHAAHPDKVATSTGGAEARRGLKGWGGHERSVRGPTGKGNGMMPCGFFSGR